MGDRWHQGKWNWRGEWPWISYFVVFLVALGVFLVLESSPVFADPDSFYHAKMAVLIRDQGIVTDFPWLRLTTLGQAYTDQHLLYHLLLVPFVAIFPPLIGLKIATVLFGASLITVIYWMFRTFKVKGAMFYALLLLLIRPFTFRIALAKAPSTSLIILIVGLAWVFRYHIKRLFVWGFIYVWYYGGFALLGVVAAIHAAVSALYNRARHQHSHKLVEKIVAVASGRRLRRKISLNWLMLFSVAGGLLAGIIFNPYFPKNLEFYRQQLLNIGIINFRSVIGVGAEWYPYKFGDLMANGAFASLLMLVAVLGIIFQFKQQSKKTWTLLVIALFFMFLTLKSRRYVEYYIPFAVIFAAFSISDSLGGKTGRLLLFEAKAMIMSKWWTKALAGLMALYLCLGVGYIAGRDFSGQMKDLRSGYTFDELGPVSRWLAANTPAGTRVVHSDWDEFPLLFYHNSHNTYIAGLDPTFLYMADKDKYWTWVKITIGTYQGDVYEGVTKTLGAQYVLVASDHEAMRRLIESDGNFTKVYADSEATVYAAGSGEL